MGCKLGICKASHRRSEDPTAPPAKALVSSTSPAKDSLSQSTQFPAWLLVQNCLLFFFFLSDFQAKQETVVLTECPCFECQGSVRESMHTCEGNEVHLSRKLKPNTSFPQPKPMKNASSCPAMRRPCRPRMCREPEQSYPSARSSANICRRGQQHLWVHPGRESEVTRFLQWRITKV